MNAKVFCVAFFLSSWYTLYSQQINVYLQKGHEYPISTLEFDKLGRMLLSSDSNHTFLLWDFFSHQEVRRYTSRPVLVNWNTDSKAKKEPAIAVINKNYKIICEKEGKTFFVIPAVLYDFNGAVLNATSDHIAYTSFHNKKIFLRPTANMYDLRVINLPDWPTSLTFHPLLPNLLLVGMNDGTITAYDILERKPIFNFVSALFDTESITTTGTGKTFITGKNSFFEKDEADPDDVVFTKANWGKNIYSYLPVSRDSFVTSYFWDNYKIYEADGDIVKKAFGLGVHKINNRIISPATELLGMALDLRSLYQLFRVAPYLTFQRNYAPSIQANHSGIWINKNQRITRFDFKTKQSESYFSYGDDDPVYAVNDLRLVIWRAPYYLTYYDVTKKGKEKVAYIKDVKAISLMGNSDTLVVQLDDSFRLIKLGADFKPCASIKGRFINYENGQVFYKFKENLLCYGSSHVPQIRIPEGLTLKRVVMSEDRGHLVYNLYFNFGTIIRANEKGATIATIYLYNGGDYLIISPDNYFYASSKKMLHNITMNDSLGHSYSLGQFELRYNRPDVVLERIGYSDMSKLELYRIAHIKNMERNKWSSAEIVPENFPTAELRDTANIYYTKDSFKICSLRYVSKKSILSSVNLTVNNNPVWGTTGIDISSRGLYQFDTIVRVSLASENNYIRPVCKDNSLLKSKAVSYFIKSDYKSQPKVYYLGIGINEYYEPGHTLYYAVSDVSSLGQKFKKVYGQNCQLDSLYNKEVKAKEVLEKINQLSACSVNDIVVISFSGHGLLSDSLDLFLGTYDVNFNHPVEGGLSYSLFEKALEKIPAHRKMVFIDACHAGGIDKKNYSLAVKETAQKSHTDPLVAMTAEDTIKKNEQEAYYMMNNIYSDIQEENGAIILTASRGNQYARESTIWGSSGVFTYCISEGLFSKRADYDRDGAVSVSELKFFLNKEVPRQSSNHQIPVFRRDNNEFDWKIR